MAKIDLEHKKYINFVLNKIDVSLQREAIRNKGLSQRATYFYEKIDNLLIKGRPFGLNLAYLPMQVGYLD